VSEKTVTRITKEGVKGEGGEYFEKN
ncbi:jg2207, partial [Pararge aegeria aegeria]